MGADQQGHHLLQGVFFQMLPLYSQPVIFSKLKAHFPSVHFILLDFIYFSYFDNLEPADVLALHSADELRMYSPAWTETVSRSVVFKAALSSALFSEGFVTRENLIFLWQERMCRFIDGKCLLFFFFCCSAIDARTSRSLLCIKCPPLPPIIRKLPPLGDKRPDLPSKWHSALYACWFCNF